MKREETNTILNINLKAKVRNSINYKNNNIVINITYIRTGLVPQ